MGSIGQRHYKNLKSLGEDDIIVFRSGRGNSDFTSKFVSEFKPNIIYDLKEALALKPDAVFITNPTAYHIPVALAAAQAGCHLFIEKPISHSFDDTETLLAEVKKKNLVSYVAYNLRFHPLLNTVKEWLGDADRFGRAVSVHASLGERVTDWHPWEDYRSSYACRQDLGGGVVLTQSHEIDYLSWLFGPVFSVGAVGGSLGGLGIGVEDVAKAIIKFKSGVVGSLDLDYLKRPPRRGLEIVTTQGCIVWDYYGKNITFVPLKSSEKEIKLFEPEGFDRNNTFLEEVKHFLDCVRSNKGSVNPVEQGIEVLKLCLGIKDAMSVERIVRL